MSLLLGAEEVIGPWVHARTGGEWIPGSGRTIGWVRDGRITAGYIFSQYNGRNLFIDYAVDGHYLPWALLYAVGAYAFEQLHCTRLTLVAEDSNLASVKINYKLGATLEATLKGAARDGGDILIFRLTPDCTIWKKLHGKIQRHARSTGPQGHDSAARGGEQSFIRSDAPGNAADGGDSLRHIQLGEHSLV